MRYLLDTNAVIDMIRGKRGLQQHVTEHGLENCYVSDMTIAELMTGYYLSGRESEKKSIDFVKETFPLVRVTPMVLDIFARSRAMLQKTGNRIPTTDLIIISTAIANDMVAVSHDEHFRLHPDLNLQDWADLP